MQAVLFDLDGTLLDIDLDAFLGRYFAALERAMQPLLRPGTDGAAALRALSAATRSMMEPHPGMTNREAFHAEFLRLAGIDILEAWEVFDRFYAEDFPSLGDGCRPRQGAVEAVAAALEAGMRVAVATNPIFPEAAVRHRLSWASLDEIPFHTVTTYEVMHACKPHPEYFRETAGMLGVPPEACLMVGDDRFLDMAAADVGMRTYYVGPPAAPPADFTGDLSGLARLLPRLAGPR